MLSTRICQVVGVGLDLFNKKESSLMFQGGGGGIAQVDSSGVASGTF